RELLTERRQCRHRIVTQLATHAVAPRKRGNRRRGLGKEEHECSGEDQQAGTHRDSETRYEIRDTRDEIRDTRNHATIVAQRQSPQGDTRPNFSSLVSRISYLVSRLSYLVYFTSSTSWILASTSRRCAIVTPSPPRRILACTAPRSDTSSARARGRASVTVESARASPASRSTCTRWSCRRNGSIVADPESSRQIA